MLRAVPVECFELELENALSLGAVITIGDFRCEHWIRVERQLLGTGIDLQTCACGIVHQKQACPIVLSQIAGADIRAVR